LVPSVAIPKGKQNFAALPVPSVLPGATPARVVTIPDKDSEDPEPIVVVVVLGTVKSPDSNEKLPVEVCPL